MQWNKPKCYAVKHKDDEVVAASRSGGVFTALSDAVLNEDGVVYGCVLTDDFRAVHIRAEDKQTRDLMRGSKYIQSYLGDTMRQVKEDLQAGRKVLFSGTSCQIAGLRGFLNKPWENLLCVDIVCHGVPSPKVWKAYLQWQEQQCGSTITSIDFRNKKDFGWKAHVETLKMCDGQEVHNKVFTTLFYQHSILRPCCYECPYKSVVHPGDVTIADYWGVENVAPEFDDDNGVSLVLINNDKGDAAFEQVKRCLRWKQTRLEFSMQTPLMRPFKKPEVRDCFWKDFLNKDFEKVAQKYVGTDLISRGRRKLQAMWAKIKMRQGKRRGVL